MAELGNKFECVDCGTKFYDLGKPKAVCPNCGTDQKRAGKAEKTKTKTTTRKRTTKKAAKKKAAKKKATPKDKDKDEGKDEEK